MRYVQATCAKCGAPIARNAPRMRLHETADSSVRHTRMVASFHPDCGRAVVDELAVGRDADVERWTWARGPRLASATA